MRLSLIDLLIAMACMTLGLLAGVFIALSPGQEHSALLFGLPLGVLAFLLFTPPIYSRFRLRPLLLPRCPHCLKRPEIYGIAHTEWPREKVVCGLCRGVSELHYRSGSFRADSETGVPRLLLRWPQSIGFWRVVSSRSSPT